MYSGNSPIPTAILGKTTKSASSSAAAADQLLSGEYEVFLSFCGKDTRNGFTDFLYTYLKGSGVHTFRDDNELRVGEEIGPELLKAIKDSKILIPIFSKNYASSKWCLLELTQMVECEAEAQGEKMIFPIFYDVDPYVIRHQSGGYKKAFHQHEKKKRLDEKTVQSWKEALTKVGQLKGLELKKETGGREGELVKITVENVLQFLKKNYTHVPKNLVGMDNHIEELKGLLKVDSNGLRIVGIHGMGGLGKTTLAKVIYNQLCEHFEGHCFLDDVREKSRPRDGIVKLQKQLISKILNREPEFNDACEGSNIIKDAVRRRKVLIVLDDVDESLQVDRLMGNQSWFGAQSRIIITTRDNKVLDAVEMACRSEDRLDVYRSYKPDFMDNHHSLQLFSKYAFRRDSPTEGCDIFSKKVVSIAAGLPLVLVVLGSAYFMDKYKDLWEEKLRKVSVIPHEKVLEKLRICFEALSDEQKQIFLDIACLFIGCDKTEPSYMWDDCKFFPGEGISDLVSRSLITVGDDNKLRMHDQLRDLGRQIVREEGLNEPGKRSRLWDEDEAIHILETHQGTSSVNALKLPIRGYDDRHCLSKFDRCLDAQDLSNLPNLRYLRMGYRQDLDGDFKHLFSNLRWLEWTCSAKFRPTNLNLRNLVVLVLSESKFTEDWEGWSELKMAKKLKVLHLTNCWGLRVVPHLSTFASLEILKLDYCGQLCRLDGLQQLKSLRHLDVGSCHGLKEIQGLEKLESLEYLDFSYCYSLRGVPDLSNLNKLKVLAATNLEIFPDFSNFKKLKKLEISSNSDNLIEFQVLRRLESLEHLAINCSSIERFPYLPNFGMLKVIEVESCDKLREVEGIGVIESLEILDIQFCDELREIADLRSLKNLKKLRIHHLNELTGIRGLEELKSLESLEISDCKSIDALPDFSKLEKLTELDVYDCVKLAEICGLEELKSLKRLNIYGCEGLKKLPDLPNTTIERVHPFKVDF